ncbi:PilW family protein [Metabacillus litoralis]|uniref:PilW family protein n=1 Tax=Metabacillus litoralis TaxID=152268 RepID=UPI000EF5F08A|nr:prepilin-type N-terminal cleavage/methylation domain-containing protein [Metabacillus litoralis]
MKNFVKDIHNEKGISLIEVMTTLLISSIILVVVYNVFIMGIKTYERVGVEAQLRDEADFIVSSILQELYDTPIDSVSKCKDEENCLEITHNKSYQLDSKFPTLIQKKYNIESETITIKLEKNNVNISKIKETGNLEKEIYNRNLLNDKHSLLFLKKINSDNILEDVKSKINVHCQTEKTIPDSPCNQGIIQIVLELQHKNFTEDNFITVDPIKFESEFGF